MKNFTDITILVDRSGSMELIKSDMETALTKFVKKHGELKTTKVTYIQFDGEDPQEVKFKGVPAYAVEASDLKIVPRGNTPLHDAVAKAIDNTGLRYSEMPESERPDQVLFVIITDGDENSSRTFTSYDVKHRIKEQTNNYKWQFTFLGANQDAILAADRMGISRNWALNFAATKAGVASSIDTVISNTMSYAVASPDERGGSLNSYTDAQRKAAVDTK